MAYVAAVATEEERAYYESTLYPLQDRVLGIAGGYGDAFVLTGGTALARGYFNHRFSDDLDLFVTASTKVQPAAAEFFALLRAEGFEVTIDVNQPGFVRGYVGIERLQVDIAHDMPRLNDPLWNERLGVFVYTLEDIGGNKIAAFEDRAEIKDVVDLYFLSQELSWPTMFAAADRKQIPIDFEALKLLVTAPVVGATLLQKPLGVSLDEFIGLTRSHISHEVKKKQLAWSLRVDELISRLLWDAPHHERRLSEATRTVLERRSARLSEPQRMALAVALCSTID